MTADTQTENIEVPVTSDPNEVIVITTARGNRVALTKEGAQRARRQKILDDLGRIAKEMSRLASPAPVVKVDKK